MKESALINRNKKEPLIELFLLKGRDTAGSVLWWVGCGTGDGCRVIGGPYKLKKQARQKAARLRRSLRHDPVARDILDRAVAALVDQVGYRLPEQLEEWVVNGSSAQPCRGY